jgi:hypothetical protein
MTTLPELTDKESYSAALVVITFFSPLQGFVGVSWKLYNRCH